MAQCQSFLHQPRRACQYSSPVDGVDWDFEIDTRNVAPTTIDLSFLLASSQFPDLLIQMVALDLNHPMESPIISAHHLILPQ